MLRRLSVENYALIEKLEMELDPHLNIITGETGAGKSILLGALGLLLGAKNDGSAMKDAARNCTVEGTFDLTGSGLETFFAENDLDYAAETTLTRVITPAGKSRAFDEADGAVMCAAVADYTPAEVSETKFKKGDGKLFIRLRRTRDIAAELGTRKGGRLLAGFALETDDEEAHAESKLTRKNFDFIVLNSLRDAGAGFRGDTNKVTLIDRTGREALPLLSKREVAARIADRIEAFFAR